jgi:hypothetical protein
MAYARDQRGTLNFVACHFILSDVGRKFNSSIPRPDCCRREHPFYPRTGSVSNIDRSSAQSIHRRARIPAISPSGYQPANGGGNRSHPILSRIVRNNSRGIATSAIWKITCREWRTTFAPILIGFSRNVVSVQ